MAEWSVELIIVASATLVFLLLAQGFVSPPTSKRAPGSKIEMWQSQPDRVRVIS